MPVTAQLHLSLASPQPGAESGDSMPDRLCALLVRRRRSLEVGHGATQLLRLRRCPEHLRRRLVAEIVEERLRQVGPGGGGRVLAKGWRTAEALEHIARAVRRLAESTDDANEAFSDG